MYPYKSLANFLGDRVVYRNLAPADRSLPQLADVWSEVGLDSLRVPRKTEPIYAATVMRFMQAAQAQRGEPPLEQILFVGDTFMNDGTAAKNLGEHLPMRGFIGADRPAEAEKIDQQGPILVANRWQALTEFLKWAEAEGLAPNNRTALVLDLDKTALGARGRNDKVIDQARVNAVRLTVEEVLGGGFDETAFRSVYDRLTQATYHPFTTDNQDYVAYISLMVVSQIYPAERFWADVDEGRLSGFHQFVTICDARQPQMSAGLLTAHREVTGFIAENDPTPFKSFRYREYHTTIGSMNFLPDDTPLAELLAREITITGEVADLAETLASRGVLTFGLSDKPDEASLPSAEAAVKGALPLHRMVMKVVGKLAA